MFSLAHLCFIRFSGMYVKCFWSLKYLVTWCWLNRDKHVILLFITLIVFENANLFQAFIPLTLWTVSVCAVAHWLFIINGACPASGYTLQLSVRLHWPLSKNNTPWEMKGRLTSLVWGTEVKQVVIIWVVLSVSTEYHGILCGQPTLGHS